MATPIPENSKTPKVFLGRSGLKVSNICLGTMTFGENQFGRPGNSSVDLSHQIINRFVEWGGNFLDSADVYGFGEAESVLGKWLEVQPRENVVIATKCRCDVGVSENVNNVGLSRRHITESIDRSLKRLHTDFVDLYQMHLFDNATPLEETLRSMDDLVRAGKVRYVGASNMTGWQLQKLVSVTRKLGLNPIISLQQQYSLVIRRSELETFQVCKSEGIGVLPWSPLKGGVLCGRIKRGIKPTEGRLGWAADNPVKASDAVPLWTKLSDKTFDIVDKVEEIATKRGRNMSQVALRWLLQKDVVTSVIMGVESLTELDTNMAAAGGWSLTKEEMEELDSVSSDPLPYPYEMVFGANTSRVNPPANDFYVSSTTG